MKSPHEVFSKSRFCCRGESLGICGRCHQHPENEPGETSTESQWIVVWKSPRCATVVNKSHSLEVFFEVGIPQFMNGLFLCLFHGKS